jgi:hypothetical protein
VTEARIDLHVHSCHSEDRERYDLPNGASFTLPFHPTLAPRQVYDLALERGLTHVTLTDHDTLAGCLELAAGLPDPSRLIFGEEVTCHHRGACLHLGVYGLTEADHAAIHAGAERQDRQQACLRWNVPQLLAFCDQRGLAYDLKHPMWLKADDGLTIEVLREVLPWFALVEGLNGTRHRWLNELAVSATRRLGRAAAGFSGGSDSHTDNVGSAYTVTEGETAAEVLANLRAGRAHAVGAAGSHRLLDGDFRKCLVSNATGSAGHFMALADDYFHNMPFFAQDGLQLALNGIVAFSVVSELDRQRRLARSLAAALAAVAPFELDLGGEPSHAPSAGGVVHRHV